MKTLRSLLLVLGLLIVSYGYSQAPKAFRYQAVVRNSSGQFIASQLVSFKISILKESESGNEVYAETQSATTNEYGLASLQIGKGTVVSGNLSDIDWSSGLYFLKIWVDPNGGTAYTLMGTSQLLSVPYAVYASKSTASDKFKVAPLVPQDPDTALFEVKDHNGQTVFAVYESGVQVIVNGGGKGGRAGFAVGGRTSTKGTVENIMNVSMDSVRIYIDTTQVKGGQAGFAVGGRSPNKGTIPSYFSITRSLTPQIINPAKPNILWYPSKTAFWAGQVLIEHPDSVGKFSIAVGDSARAIGINSQAFGYRPTARADYSTAIGNNALASGNVSFALGSGAQATGNYSFSFGSTGLNEDGTPSGSMTRASGMYSFAFGMGSNSAGYGSFSYGMNCNASADYSTALGLGANVTGRCATSLGYYNTAQAFKSIVLGTYNVISGTTDSWVDTDPLFVLGNGTGGYNFIRLLGKGSSGFILPIIIDPLPIIRPPILTINRSNAFMIFKNGNALLGGGSTYTTDQGARLFIRKKPGSSTAYNYEEGLKIREGGLYDYGPNIAVQDYNGNTVFWVKSSNSTYTYTLWIAGSAYASSGVWTASDSRLKTNIIPLMDVLRKVDLLNGVQYEWNTKDFPQMNFERGQQIGIIAQDIEKIFPELVKTDDKGYKSVAYDKLSVVAISAIKEQQKEIESLKTEIELLKKENARLQTLESRIEQLEQKTGK